MRAIFSKLTKLANNVSKSLLSARVLSAVYTLFNILFYSVVVVLAVFFFYFLSFYAQVSFLKNTAIWVGVGLSFY